MNLQCCKNNHKFLITYNVGPEKSKWKVCEKHFNADVLFQKNIEEKKEIKDLKK